MAQMHQARLYFFRIRQACVRPDAVSMEAGQLLCRPNVR
jgi:hypothetical protein